MTVLPGDILYAFLGADSLEELESMEHLMALVYRMVAVQRGNAIKLVFLENDDDGTCEFDYDPRFHFPSIRELILDQISTNEREGKSILLIAERLRELVKEIK